MKTYAKGFTLPELIVTIGIFAVLIGLVTINIVRSQYKTSLDSATSLIIAGLNNQKMKAYTGDTEGRASNDSYGIYLENTSYVLFHGPNYSPGDLSNVTIPLDDTIQIVSNNFPQSQIVFASGSGQLSGFLPGSNFFTLRNMQNGEQKTITINRLGVVTEVN